jgi:hypothetical protein
MGMLRIYSYPDPHGEERVRGQKKVGVGCKVNKGSGYRM